MVKKGFFAKKKMGTSLTEAPIFIKNMRCVFYYLARAACSGSVSPFFFNIL